MADPLYLSVWFPQSDMDTLIPRLLSVMSQFPSSAARPGVEYVSIHPVSWSEPTVLERRFRPGVAPDEAASATREFLHPDYAYVFETHWDLWTPRSDETAAQLSRVEPALDAEPWVLAPRPVSFTAYGPEFDEGAYQQNGHIQVDFGPDTPFLHEELELTGGAGSRVRANVQKLVNFTAAVEKNAGISGRLLWSESEENLAQKLIARLQNVQ